MEAVVFPEVVVKKEIEVEDIEFSEPEVDKEESFALNSARERKYPCRYCKFEFKTFYQLYRHQHRHTLCQLPKKLSYKIFCPRCKTTYRDFVAFRKHVIGCFREKSRRLAMVSEMLNPVVKLTKKPLKTLPPKPKRKSPPKKNCDNCGLRFRSSSHYAQHLRRKSACRRPPYVCLKCNKEFTNVYNLVMHEKRKNSCVWFMAQLRPHRTDVGMTREQPAGMGVSEDRFAQNAENECLPLDSWYNKNAKKEPGLASGKVVRNRALALKRKGFHQCKVCLKVFPYFYRLKVHMDRKTPCNRFVNSDALSADLETQESAGKNFSSMHYGESVLESLLSGSVNYSSKNISARNTLANKPTLQKPKQSDNIVNPSETTNLNSGHLSCEECNKFFSSTSAWYKHGRKYHYEESVRSIKCPDCKLNFQSKYLLLGHQRKAQHWGKSHCACPFCQKQFSSYKIRNMHIRTSHKANKSKKVKEFLLLRTCQLCSEEFVNPGEKERHMKMQHNDVLPVANSAENCVNSNNKKPSFTCLPCKVVFKKEHNFKAHVLRCPALKSKPPNASLIVRGKKDGSSAIYLCKECGMTFTTKHHFTGHTNRFCPNRKGCNEPVKTTKRGRGILSIENGNVSYVCSLCNMKFGSRFEYSIHARSVCPMRNKGLDLEVTRLPFSLKPNENETSKDWSSAGLKQINENGFTGKLTLKPKHKIETATQIKQRTRMVDTLFQQTQTNYKSLHIATKDKSVERKTYSCYSCKGQFTDVLDYRLHDCKEMKTSETWGTPFDIKDDFLNQPVHKSTKKFYAKNVTSAAVITSNVSYRLKRYPNTCPFCGRRFCNSYVRDRHLRLHTLDRSFSCEHCSECFNRSEALIRHMQCLHKHLLKYECVKCGSRYPTKLHCRHHINKMHKVSGKNGLINEVKIQSSPKKTVIPGTFPGTPGTEPVVENKPNKTASFRANQPLPSNILRVAKNAPGRGIFSCELCQVGNFAKMSTLQRHLKSRLHRENIRNRRLRTALKKLPNSDPTDNRNVICSFCNQSFMGINAFVPHRLGHFNAKNVDPTEISESNPYACEICCRKFSHHQQVQAHLLWHLRTTKVQRFTGMPKGVTNVVDSFGFQRPCGSVNGSPIKESPAKKTIGGGSPVKLPTDSSNLQDLFVHSKPSLNCSNCREYFATEQLYHNHVCTYTLFCDDCGGSFSSKRGLSIHQNKWCKKGSGISQQSKNHPHESTEANKPNKPFSCKRCKKTFENEQQREEHFCTKANICSDCGISFGNARGLSVHRSKWCKKIVYSKPHTCRYCMLEFNSSDDVGWHEKSCQKVHSSENGSFDQNETKPFSCKFCNETAASYDALLQHTRDCTWKPSTNQQNENRHHTVQCLVCQQTFFNSQKMEEHSKLHPEQDVQLHCLTCNKTMDLLSDACRHIDLKNNENSMCDPFDDKFSEIESGSVKEDDDGEVICWNNSTAKTVEYDSSFEPETFVVHSPKLGKLYQCIHCRKLYRDKFHLKAHLVIHKPFVCSVCGQMECTTQGYQSHPCRLPNGSFATGILHRKKVISSTSPNVGVLHDVHSTTTAPISDTLRRESNFTENELQKLASAGVSASQSVELASEDPLDSLRDNFSQLLFLLVADPELMTNLGWGKKLVDLVLDDVLLHLGQKCICKDKVASDIERLRKNILLFLQLCIKEDVLNSVGGCAKPIDVVVTDMLKVCTEGMHDNLANGTRGLLDMENL